MAPSLAFSIDETFGALWVGFTVSVFLFGVCTTQLYLYIINFPNDTIWVRAVVWTVCILELVHLIAASHAIYSVLITDYGNIATLMTTHTGFHIAGVAANLVSMTVKGFFIFRIWSISKSIPLVLGLSLLALAATGSYFAATILGIITPTLLEFGLTFEWIIIFSPSMSAATDICITIALCFLLRQSISKIGHDFETRSNQIVHKITAWTLETGLFTSAFQLALAISAGVNPLSMVWTALWLCTCRCYANSMLATLNGRVHLRSIDGRIHGSGSIGTETGSYTYRDTLSRSMGRSNPSVRIARPHPSTNEDNMRFEMGGGLKVVKHVQHDYF